MADTVYCIEYMVYDIWILYIYGIEYMVYDMWHMVCKHKDSTNYGFWIPFTWALEPECETLMTHMFMWSSGTPLSLISKETCLLHLLCGIGRFPPL